MRGRGMIFGFIVYLIFGLYFINFGIDFIKLPEVMDKINNWIFIVGGVLIILGGINFFRASRNY